jgi:hypothetical protein
MSFINYLEDFINDFHKNDEISRKHYCKEHFNRECNICDHFWCESNPNHDKNAENNKGGKIDVQRNPI